MAEETSSPLVVEGKEGVAARRKQALHHSEDFHPQPDWTLISQGAEARIWKIPSYKKKRGENGDSTTITVVAKERFSKAYRHAVLDERLTKQRCRAEARILEKCANKAQFRVPTVIAVEAPVLYLEYLGDECITSRDYLQRELLKETSNGKEKEKSAGSGIIMAAAVAIGQVVGLLHCLGIVHGDLTTSNMMLHGATEIATKDDFILIDFGLSKNTESAEERAVDLYVLERALTATHPALPDEFWSELLQEYGKTTAKHMNAKKSDAVLQRLEQVRQRGRKRDCFG